jgi:hypothetical protein
LDQSRDEGEETGSESDSPFAAEMEFTHSEMLDNSEDDRDESPGQKDIFKIVSQCLKNAQKLRSGHTIKILTQLTAVSEYVKLQGSYLAYNRCKRPHINASIAIAQHMGKGPYFARQIRKNEKCLLRHHRLPLSKAAKKGGPATLLDNEDVLCAVRVYLATQKLGTITPFLLCKHVNTVILPALELTKKKATICERTTINWLRKLRYQCKDVRKGIYIDGHKRPDVIETLSKFLEKMAQYER